MLDNGTLDEDDPIWKLGRLDRDRLGLVLVRLGIGVLSLSSSPPMAYVGSSPITPAATACACRLAPVYIIGYWPPLLLDAYDVGVPVPVAVPVANGDTGVLWYPLGDWSGDGSNSMPVVSRVSHLYPKFIWSVVSMGAT